MKLTKQDEKDLMQVYDIWWNSYLNGDVKTYDSYLADDYHFIGSTNNEDYLNRKDTTKFFKDTAEQMSGKAELRNLQRTMDVIEKNIVLVTDLANVYILSGKEWIFYSRFRFTSLMKKTKDGWRFTYQHFSAPDNKAQDGEILGTEQISKENQELRDAIKRRTIELEHKNKELEIEKSLEKVRAQALGMKKPEDLPNVCEILYKELKTLGFGDLRNAMVNIHDDDKRTFNNYDYSDEIGKSITPLFYDIHPVIKKQIKKIRSADDAFSETVFKGKDLESWKAFRKSQGEKDDKRMRNCKALYYYFYSIGTGSIGISTFHAIPKEQQAVLKRFRNVFAFAYRRYMDVAKAETQAKEAQIEASLERVRAASMAMHRTNDIGNVVVVFFEQLKHLNITFLQSWITILHLEEGYFDTWFSPIDGIYNEPVHFKMPSAPFEETSIKSWKSGVPFSYLSFKTKVEVDQFLLACDELINSNYFSHAQKKLKYPRLEFVEARHKYGFISKSTLEKPTKEDEDILMRFAKVFEQTYTRFLDLQKAEAQAKEAQVEAALERVRSRSMAMHKSEELKDVIQVVYEQLIALSFQIEHAGFIMDYKENDDMHIWLTDKHEVPSQLTIPYFDCAHWNSFNNAKKKGLDFFSNHLEFKEKNKFYKDLFSLIPTVPKETSEYYLSCTGLDISTVLLENVGLYIENFQGIPYSDEENKTLMRFGKVFQQTYTRFQDLQKAETQIREARIETALERMRAIALNIRTTEEVLLVAESMYKELKFLDFNNIRNAQIVIDLKQNDTYLVCIHSDDTSEIIRESRYETSPIIQQLYDELDASNDAFYQKEMKGDEFKKWLKWRKSITETIDDRILEAKSISFYLFSIGEGHLGISAFNTISEEKVDILKRFRNVFEMTYRRFIELQKSEAQAREVLIEAALEKIRSRSLAVHKSDEFNEVVSIVFEKLKELQIPATAVGIAINIENSKDLNAFVCGENEAGLVITNYRLPYFNNKISTDLSDVLEKQLDFYVGHYSKEEKNSFYKYVLENTAEFKHIPEDIKSMIFESPSYTISMVAAKHAVFNINDFEGKNLSNNDIDILKRFTKVFDQAYTRFLDLQKAEAQTKESRIEASLEKVRSVALSLTKSEDMLDIAKSLFEQLLELGFTDMRNAIIDIHNDDNESFIDYDYSHDMSSAITPFSFYGDPVIEQQIKKIESSNDAFFEIELKGKQIDELIATRLRNGEKDDPRLRQTDHLTYNLYSFGNGAIGISNFGILSDDQKEILKRFRNVFTFAYQRYTDLRKAEIQARESLIEIGLERVRSRTLAMQTSDELAETAVVVFKQLMELGIEPNRLYIGIIQEENQLIEMWATDEDGSKIGSKVIFDSKKNSSVAKIYNGWKKQVKSLNFVMEGKELSTYLKYLNEEVGISVAKAGFQKKRFQSVGFFSKGLIGIAAPEEQPEETTKLLERFAGVFNLTYTRFKDLKVAEAQSKKAEEDLINLKLAKKRAEDALTELQHTQKQLIQSEKMASLGELTAGIAHEIQNPLNFVNNFSEVSNELIDEMNEEIEKGDLEEAKFIMADIKSNLEKISHHGRRAEAIVKGMLQHSRTSSAEKEPTDINKLADEYFRLAYHGLRAKDRTFNATLETDYDEGIGQIPVIAQDMGRVILNLITNAFYVVNEKNKSGIDSYEPKVTVSTKKQKNNITISVKDNGNGIPKHVLDKIFQPFFTTKPTGQGTGLGLSMSYDIVTKSHGGELTVETEEGKGTEFKITIPSNL